MNTYYWCEPSPQATSEAMQGAPANTIPAALCPAPLTSVYYTGAQKEL